MVKNPVFLSALIIAVLIYSGLFVPKKRNPFFCLCPKESVTSISGRVVSNPVKSNLFNSSYRVTLNAKSVTSSSASFSASGNLILYFPSNFIEAYYPGKLYTSIPSSATSPSLVEIGSSFNIKVEGQFLNDEYVFIVKDFKKIHNKEQGIIPFIFKIRALSRIQFKRLMFAWGKAGALLLSLLSGSREYTEKKISDGFRNSGLSHVLALSGMHLGLFGSLANFIGKKARGRNLGDAVQLFAILFFVWFAGFSPSLFRAFLSALILYFNSLFRMNRPDSLSLLSVSFIIHLIIFPSHFSELAFMLSYSSLLGIILFNKMFKKLYPHFIPYRLRMSLCQSTAAQFTTAPIALKLFGRLFPQGIIAGIFISPMILVFLYSGLFGIIICLILPFLSGPFSVIMNCQYFLISKIILFFSFNK